MGKYDTDMSDAHEREMARIGRAGKEIVTGLVALPVLAVLGGIAYAYKKNHPKEPESRAGHTYVLTGRRVR